MCSHKYDFCFKLLIIGESLVGKSCLFDRFFNDKFDQNHLATIGINDLAKIINIEGKLIKLQIYDTPGAERFRTITKAYYKGSHGILIVYDVTDYDSFKKVRYWLKQTEVWAQQNVIKVLVGNKCDKPKRAVSKEEGKKFAEEFNVSFFEVSAKSGLNVNETFNHITKQILSVNKKELGNKNENEINELKVLLSKEKSKREALIKKIESLEKKLKEEKNRNKILFEKFDKLNIDFEKDIKALKKELEEEKEKNKILEDKIKNIQKEYEKKQKCSLKEINYNENSKESLVNAILEKDREINELKKKLLRYPFELNEGEKMMTINFISAEQKINNYSIICKNTDIFNYLEKKLYEEYKEFYETENYFTVNGKKIHKLKSLDENQIKNNDVIVLNTLDI